MRALQRPALACARVECLCMQRAGAAVDQAVHTCMRACVCACMRACVHACVRVCLFLLTHPLLIKLRIRLVFEKYDGIRAVWHPSQKQFFSRNGKSFFTPWKP